MPELPEVETVRRGLEPVMAGQRIATVDVRREGLRWPFPAGLAERLTGVTVSALRRRSKYILLDLDSGEVMMWHLGMSGRVLISGVNVGEFHHPHAAPQKHDHLLLDMAQGARITFNDPRRFGAIDLMSASDEAAHPLLAKLGPEPLGNDFHEDHLAARLAGRRVPIKQALLDQHIVAGLGNIYVCEVLHRAGIHPARPAGDVTSVDVARLVPLVREVLQEAITAGGSSLRDYRRTDGELGYFQHSFRVYDRERAACATPGCAGTVARIVQGGRSSFFCPQCQR